MARPLKGMDNPLMADAFNPEATRRSRLCLSVMAEVSAQLKLNRSGHYHGMPDHHMWRSHPEDCLLIWVLGGLGFGRVRARRVDAQPGDLLCFPRAAEHEYGSSPAQPWEILWCHFTGKAAMPAVRALGGGQVLAGLGHDAGLRADWLALVAAQRLGGLAGAARLDGAFASLIGRLLTRWAQRAEPATPATMIDLSPLHAWASPSNASATAGQWRAQPPRLQALADHAGLSVPQYCRRFREQTGQSPMRYLTQARVARARELLMETTLSVKQAALAVGYDDPLHFSKVFRRVLGVPPSACRAASASPTSPARARRAPERK